MALFARKSKSTQDEAAPVSMPTAPGASASGATTSVSDMPDIASIPDGFPADAAPAKAGLRRRKGAPKNNKNNNVARSAPRGIKGGVVVGLNIGNDTIKAVEVRGRGAEAVVTAIGMIPTPIGSLDPRGVVMSPSALSTAIRQLFAQSGIRTRNVISSVAGGSTLVVRVLEVPKMSDSELADNMNMDLERYVPFPPADVVKDFRALRELPSDPDAPNMEVLLAAAQSETIDLHLKILQGAKLEAQAIDVEPLASARALFYGSRNIVNNGAANGGSHGGDLTPDVANNYNDATALINIGATSTEISVLRGDVLVFTRAVPIGGNAFTQALADHLGLTLPEAERLKREMGDALPPHVPNAVAAPTAAEDDWSAFGDPDDAPVNTVQTTSVQPAPLQATRIQVASGATSPANSMASTSPNVATGSVEPSTDEEADPFDMDIFNKGPRTDDPQEGHLQKQDDKPPFNFDLSRFNFSEEEAEVDDDIPTHPVEADDNPATPLSQTTSRVGVSDASTVSSAAVPVVDADVQNPNVLPTLDTPEHESTLAGSDQALPSLEFPMAGEEGGLSSMAPSGQMYGVGSVDDPELPSFPSLPQGLGMPDGLLAPGVEDYSDGAEDMLPSVADESVVVPASQGQPSAAPSVLSANTTFTGAAPQEDLIPTIATPTVITPGAATVTGAPMFDFSAPIAPEGEAQTGGGDDFDSAFADMIAVPAEPSATPTTPVAEGVPGAMAPVATPGSLSSPYAVDPAVAAGATDFDLDQFAAPAAVDDSFRMEDFGLGVGDEGATTPASTHAILQPRLGELVNEVRRSLEYYASRYPDAGVQRIVLVGGGSRMPNMDALMTQEIGIPAMVHNPLAHVALQVKDLPNGFVDQNGPAFAVALGLALRDLVA